MEESLLPKVAKMLGVVSEELLKVFERGDGVAYSDLAALAGAMASLSMAEGQQQAIASVQRQADEMERGNELAQAWQKYVKERDAINDARRISEDGFLARLHKLTEREAAVAVAQEEVAASQKLIDKLMLDFAIRKD